MEPEGGRLESELADREPSLLSDHPLADRMARMHVREHGPCHSSEDVMCKETCSHRIQRLRE